MDQGDPLSLELQGTFDEQFLAVSSSRRRHSGSIELRRHSQDSIDSNHGHLTKEIVIHIPTPSPRALSGVERILASIMSGGRNGTSIHGLTGKPLLFVHPISFRI